MNPDAVVDIPAIRHLYPDLPASTIRWWAAQGWIDPRGSNGRGGRRLYRLGDVVCMRKGWCLTNDRTVTNTLRVGRGVSTAA